MAPCGHVNKHNVDVAFFSPLSLFSICRGGAGSAARFPTCSSNYPHYWLIFHVVRRATRGHLPRRRIATRVESQRRRLHDGGFPDDPRWFRTLASRLPLLKCGAFKFRLLFFCFFFLLYNPSSLFFPPLRQLSGLIRRLFTNLLATLIKLHFTEFSHNLHVLVCLLHPAAPAACLLPLTADKRLCFAFNLFFFLFPSLSVSLSLPRRQTFCVTA